MTWEFEIGPFYILVTAQTTVLGLGIVANLDDKCVGVFLGPVVIEVRFVEEDAP